MITYEYYIHYINTKCRHTHKNTICLLLAAAQVEHLASTWLGTNGPQTVKGRAVDFNLPHHSLLNIFTTVVSCEHETTRG